MPAGEYHCYYLMLNRVTAVKVIATQGTMPEAVEIIPINQLGTTDDCGFFPFADDTSTSRDTAFEKIKARIKGTVFAEQKL
jgi:hypothetical protein